MQYMALVGTIQSDCMAQSHGSAVMLEFEGTRLASVNLEKNDGLDTTYNIIAVNEGYIIHQLEENDYMGVICGKISFVRTLEEASFGNAALMKNLKEMMIRN